MLQAVVAFFGGLEGIPFVEPMSPYGHPEESLS